MPVHSQVSSPSAPAITTATASATWRAHELLLMSQVMRLVGQSLAPDVVLREMLHLMSELLGLNRGRIVLADDFGDTAATRAPRRNAEARLTCRPCRAWRAVPSASSRVLAEASPWT